MHFRNDYRVILRRFEFERLMVPPPLDHVTFGGRYSNRLLEDFYATDARHLDKTFQGLNQTQQTLYALNALCGEVSNGGISQFFFNSTLFLRDAVATALERIGAAEAAGRYANVSSRSKSNGRLGWIRRLATGWRDYLSYKEELGGEQAIDAEFDDWFFADGQDGLEALTRTYLSGREHDLIRFCDGDPGLEARWTSRRLARLVYDFDQYQDAFERGTRYGFFDLLFTPECRLGLGDSPEERLERGRLIAIELMPLIRSAVEQPKTAHYSELPSPRILVENLSAAGGNCAVTVAYHENELDLMWSIAEWR